MKLSKVNMYKAHPKLKCTNIRYVQEAQQPLNMKYVQGKNPFIVEHELLWQETLNTEHKEPCTNMKYVQGHWACSKLNVLSKF